MNDLVANPTPTDLEKMTTAQLRKELSESLRWTAAHLLRTAQIVRLLEERGEDLSELRIGLLHYLRKIAHGQMLPEVVIRFGESPQLIHRIASLPIPDQRRLAAGDLVAVVTPKGTEEVDPLTMSRDQVARVFARDYIRDPKEQRLAFLDQMTPRSARKLRKYDVRVDRRNRMLRIGRASIPIEAVLTALSEAAGYQGAIEESELPHRQKAHAPLTDEEKERLKAMAKATGLSETEVVRRAILAWLI